MGVQIGVHNIAPCFVGKGGVVSGKIMEGANVESGLDAVGRLPGVLMGRGEGEQGRLGQKWQVIWPNSMEEELRSSRELI
jgi:hypothetical protein